QPRGGPSPSGHASHQNGLDVDLLFLPLAGDHAESMVDAAHQKPSPRFTPAIARVLELVAADARVDRIFIAPVLKRALCEKPPGERAWLRKLIPWWGHDDHYHVRLLCPADSAHCVPQPPLGSGDGCDRLDWWFDEKDGADRAAARKRYTSRVGAVPELPS